MLMDTSYEYCAEYFRAGTGLTSSVTAAPGSDNVPRRSASAERLDYSHTPRRPEKAKKGAPGAKLPKAVMQCLSLRTGRLTIGVGQQKSVPLLFCCSLCARYTTCRVADRQEIIQYHLSFRTATSIRGKNITFEYYWRPVT